MPLAKVRVHAPDPGGAFGGKQHAKFEPLVAFAALRTGRPVRLVLTLEQTFQAVRRAASEVRVRTGFRTDGSIAFQDIAADYLIGAYADIADRVVGKGSYPACGPYNVPAARILARSILSHTTPSTAFRGFGYPQVNWAVESNLDEGARDPGHRPARPPAAQPRPQGRRVHPVRHAGRRRVGAGRAPGGRADRLGHAAPRRPRPGHRRRDQVRPDDGPFVLDRPPAGRRQRGGVRGDLGHGPGRADDLCPDRRPGARRAPRLGHGRDGRHGRGALRPADLGQPLDGPDGQLDPGRLPADPGPAAHDGGPAPRRGRVGDQRGRRRRAAAGSRAARDRRPQAGSGPARRRARRQRRGAQGGRGRTTRSAVRRRSSSSTARRSRPRSTATRAT